MLVWKILCIDRAASTSNMTKLLLEKLFFLEREVRVLKATSLDIAENMLENIDDIAVILLDIEDDKSRGLRFINDVRNKYRNQRVRIVLRTGYPCTLPSKRDIQDYMIDGYIPKDIMSETQIEITVMTAIRSYHQIINTETMLSGLAGSIAHEMRNPLAQIHGSLQLMKIEIPNLNDNEHIQDAHKIIQNGLQMIDLTMDAIVEKPIDTGSFKLLSARDLVKEAVQDYAYAEAEHSNKVSVKGGDFNMMGDLVMVKYVLYNLIKNALYYVKTLPDAEIIISVMPTVNGANQIEVRDTGPGIAPEALPKLFDNFYSADKQGGTGLGLSYCKRTMTALGGEIHCESELDQYTAFTLSFPMALADQVAVEAVAVEKVANKHKPLTKPVSLKEKTVLVVEDERISRMMVKGILEKQGAFCLEAENGQEALQLLSKHHCDLILTDMRMPIMNGLELIKTVRQRKTTANNRPIPIMLITSEDTDAVDEAIKLGVDDYLAKPVSVEMLVPKLQQWLVG